ncbi:acyl-CoA Delta(11) desaturase-like [Culicoides brevitarsis]|uniref:acyl-CoA Delta(11) desaturase-like n=1 Tax=Culicoides brevitarsis TaxID=469753 RepID=UPI00307CBA00
MIPAALSPITMVNGKSHEIKAVQAANGTTKSFGLSNNSYVVKNGEKPEYEDKTSDNYVPKSYRSQSKLGLLATHFLDKYLGIRFLQPIKWQNTISIFALHFYFLFMVLKNPWNVTMWQTGIWGFVTGIIGGFGVTGGAHRLWSHKAYKAKLPLRIILMLCYCVSGQNSLYDWIRDHRIHHKYSETDADPHNSNRGFFFAHVGWLMLYKHPEVIKKGNSIDLSDILADPVIQFHQKYFIPLKLLLAFYLPCAVAVYGWGETWFWAFISQAIVRYVFGLNFTWSVNSVAHLWGFRSYDKRINPVENVTVAIFAMGEGWHNYHHVFPWDYKAAELGDYKVNITTMFIDFFAWIGWAYDLKQPTKDMVRRTVEKYGDGSHDHYGHFHPEEVPDPEETNNNVSKED